MAGTVGRDRNQPKGGHGRPARALSNKSILRFATRCLALVVATLLVLVPAAYPLPLAALSPFVGACSAVAAKTSIALILLGLPVLVLASFFSRWFCRFACPVGFLQELVSKLRPRTTPRWRRWPRLGPWFALLTLGGACVGYPLFLWLDPLAIFSGFFGAWRQPLAVASACAGLAFPFALLFDFLFPKSWCMRICPLGASQDLLSGIRRRLLRSKAAASETSRPFAPARRGFLVAGAGALAGLTIRKSHGKTPPLRPPGALDEARFTGVCIRCGSCSRVCPTRILQPDLGAHGLTSFLAPVASFDHGYCREDCHRCGQVCPSGAIERLSLAEKRRRVIGRAEVDLVTCLLANGQDCTACIRACPYEALTVFSDGFDSHPALDLARCTGCGACELPCPVTPRRAIRVIAIPGLLTTPES